MPLDCHQEGVVGFLHGFYETIRGVSTGDQARGEISDRLVMHAVDLDGAALQKSGDPGKHGADCHVHGVAGDVIIKRLVVGDRRGDLILAFDILIDGAAQTDVDELDTPADSKDWFPDADGK